MLDFSVQTNAGSKHDREKSAQFESVFMCANLELGELGEFKMVEEGEDSEDVNTPHTRSGTANTTNVSVTQHEYYLVHNSLCA